MGPAQVVEQGLSAESTKDGVVQHWHRSATDPDSPRTRVLQKFAVSPRSQAADEKRERAAAERASARLAERQQQSSRKARARRVDFGDSDGEAD